MGGVDLADQLRGNYCIYKGVRNRKWWWSILFWSIVVMITNAYVIYYTSILRMEFNIYILSHHDFRKALALAWINPIEQDE